MENTEIGKINSDISTYEKIYILLVSYAAADGLLTERKH